jgi:hypothetical protein
MCASNREIVSAAYTRREAQAPTIRLKLLKIGALIRIKVRKVWVSLAGRLS